MENKVTIRKASPADWQIVQQLNANMYPHQAQFDPYLDMEEPFTKDSVESYKDDVSSPEKCCLIAEVKGKPVGCLLGSKLKLVFRTITVGEINYMSVNEEYRSQGIGSKLVDGFRAWCRKNGLKLMSATAYYHNTATVKFYQKHGLKPEGVILEGEV